jgi:hypothetical protein
MCVTAVVALSTTDIAAEDEINQLEGLIFCWAWAHGLQPEALIKQVSSGKPERIPSALEAR